jgi:hypothetical protein
MVVLLYGLGIQRGRKEDMGVGGEGGCLTCGGGSRRGSSALGTGEGGWLRETRWLARGKDYDATVRWSSALSERCSGWPEVEATGVARPGSGGDGHNVELGIGNRWTPARAARSENGWNEGVAGVGSSAPAVSGAKQYGGLRWL